MGFPNDTAWEAKKATVAATGKASISLGDYVSELTIVASAAVTLAKADGATNTFIVPANTPISVHDAHTWSGTIMYFTGAQADVVTALVTYGTKRGGR
jgi:hypothetical protein